MAETREGGVYKVGDEFVDAGGEKVKAPSRADASTGTRKKEGEGMPYADVLSAAGYKDAAAIRAAKDEDLLAVEGIGPTRLAEIRAYKG